MKPAPKKQINKNIIIKKVSIPEAKNNKQQLWFLIIIALLCFVIYFPSLKYSIDVWDDPYYIINNPLIKSFKNLTKIFTTSYLANYQPLTLLSYMFEYGFVKTSPFLYHFDNLLLHMLNSILVFLLIKKLSKNEIIGFFAGVLFAVHPLHIESVAWVSQRKDLIYSIFYILSLMFYLDFKEKKATKYLIYSLVMFSISCLSKGMAVVLPLTLILIDFCFDKKFSIKTLANKIPFFLISIILGISAVVFQKEGGAIGFTSKDVFTVSDKFFFINYSFFFYIWKMILPFHLSGLYPYPMKSGNLPLMFYLAPLFNLIIFGGVLYSLKYSRKILFGFGFYIINVIMILQILSVGSAIAADRYFYVASIGLFFIASLGIEKLNKLEPFKKIKFSSYLIIFILVIYFSAISLNRMSIWKNAGTFWVDVTNKFPEIDVAWFNAGAYYFSNNKHDEALNYFNHALNINPNHLDALKWRGVIYGETNNFQGALNDYLKIIENDPNNSEAYSKVGELYGKNFNDINKSIMYLKKAVELNPNNEPALCNLGVAYGIIGDSESALKYFMMAYNVNPNNPNTLSNIASYYRQKGDVKKADEFLSKAKQLSSK